MKEKVFRPNLDDVERLSYGKGAKRQRGTGSKYVCHRLNQNERILYNIAKEYGYLSVKGTGYRKERKGSPVSNTFRQRCDSLENICVIIEKRSDGDRIVVDFSTLRVKDDSQHVQLILDLVKSKYSSLLCDEDVLQNYCMDKVDWEKVKTEPIWNVPERLVVINCDRDIAKSLAVDILKENSLFHKKIVVEETKEEENLSQSLHNIYRPVNKDTNIHKIYKNDEKEEDSDIDWDDI